MFTFIARARRSHHRGFTLVELLVVMAVMSILATLLMPALLRSITATKTAACISNLRQMGQGYAQYTSAWESWLICAGNNATEHDRKDPIFEDAWITPWVYRADFPYWYETLTEYCNPGLTPDVLAAAYRAEYGGQEIPDLSQSDMDTDIGETWGTVVDDDSHDGEQVLPPPPDQTLATSIEKIRHVRAKAAGIFACPELKQNAVGYGYNYVAPFGNPSCYGSNGLVRHFRWKTARGPRDYPARYNDGKRWMIPILWFGRSAHYGVLATPSQQILICDTGYVINAYRDVTKNHFGMVTPRHPSEWLERVMQSRQGYVRFPLSDATVNAENYKLKRYRPMPRHGGRVSCLMFDGSSQALPILDIVGVQWGGQDCWYDNIPKTKPPVSPLSVRGEIQDDQIP